MPGSPVASKSLSPSAISTPVSRFVKESSFRIEDDDESERKDGRKSGSLDVSFGIVHLFRDDDSLKATNAKTSTTLEDDTGSILAVLGVPSYIGPADFLQLIEPAANAISQVRMIREETAGRCMVLLKFRDAANAEEFHKMYADQPFDPTEDPDELCRVVYVTKVTVSTTSTLPYAYPLLANSDPWPIIAPERGNTSTSAANSIQRIPSLSELPTCPVCLERMDSSVTGLMTVTCQHTFHCSCLSRWSDSRCPVCRYTQSRLTKKGHILPFFVPEHGCCAVCGTGSDLWVCLICATVGCGRYKAGHAHRHFKETGHLYSLELESQRVWDYAGDGYVHRLIQSKAEFGVLDEASGSMDRAGESGSTAPGGQSMADVEDKMEALGLEYSHLLSTQLESQRAFYEDQVRAHQQKVESSEEINTRTALALDQSQKEREELRNRLEAVTSRHDHLQTNLEVSLKRIKKLDEDLRGERLMAQGLVSRIEKMTSEDKGWQKEIESLRSENAELKEQVRDLMFFVEARAKVEHEGGEELREGDVQMGGRQNASAGSANAKKKKKKVAKKPPMQNREGQPSSAPTTEQAEEIAEVNEENSPQENEEADGNEA
ncbi:zf-UBP-domain-containing protein [Meira miltonrushii]|uniref:Zf-UBP-domain-containing protein n=1 Tax=Meira miltonrushii TaxID=1280837 RepID=A0A316V2D7_9BASI|nr:zf-UBP-domain-containing protein [Meira miltonrushii]PWN31622.1 zf-UBP-domain-containing protein [Meira miltonrushii]